MVAVGLYRALLWCYPAPFRQEYGSEMLGAPEHVVILMIMRETGWLLVIGFSAGLALTVAIVRLISSRLYGLAPTDPVAIASAIVLLAFAALLAAWVPAHRASRIDPLVALRYE